MIYKQLSYLPIIFQVDEGIVLGVDEYLRRNKLSFTNILVVSGKNYSNKIGALVADKNGWNRYTLEDNTFREVELLKTYVNRYNIDLLVGVGGGKVIDTVKRVGYLSNTNNLSIPTIISNDGLISPISVIKNELGKTESLPAMMPMGVIIDIDIIKESPVKFLQAAAGDVLANLSATNDWVLAFQQDRERMNDIAFHLSRSAVSSLINFDEIHLLSKSFLRLLVQGLVNSGIAMALSGTSRPCSGSEHQISHAIDFLEYGEGVLHGTQVGSISLFSLFLQNKVEAKQMKFARTVGIPLLFDGLIRNFSSRRFEEIIDKSREMRPGRYSILDMLTTNQVMEKYEEFRAFIKSNNF
ncbi:iron-containing alcohol dehydrogenase family protein [Sphingobacterium yanglingense]|uniref:Glycerol-1-phosphate dehydrogenase [NAD(P)+] n=1 Tax=Sphingobacterium yanglingense TaxID=1437280 RepID=A0A4V3DDT0_9SPHI|nr:iron-containing alcohol dehydrogenase family protein [Sphingobacterium yanglingense]TDQ77988.1 glycerol-1-phosphate dehydrogenase [NAD(P)+] [Sphingobacterium yanglingense]